MSIFTIFNKFDSSIEQKDLFCADYVKPISTYVLMDATRFGKDLGPMKEQGKHFVA